MSSTLLSIIGDQLAKVALSILVFQRTSSTLLTALTYGLSYLPWVIGGPLLSTLADRLPRRQGADHVRSGPGPADRFDRGCRISRSLCYW